jgi:general secretion pathway protein L
LILPPDTKRFFSWWLQELQGCIPAAWRKAWQQRRAVLTFQAVGDILELRRRQAGSNEVLGRIDLEVSPIELVRDQVSRAIGSSRRGMEILLLLSSEQAIQTNISLPLAARANIRDLLNLEMDRFTPFRGEDVVFGYRIDRIDRAAKQMGIRLAAVPKPQFEAILRRLFELGFLPDRVQVVGEPGFWDPVDLPLSDADVAARRPWRWLNPALGVVFAALALVALLLPIWQQRSTLSALETRLAEAQTSAKIVEILQQKIADRGAQSDTLLHRRNRVPPATVIVNELARLLDDGAWIEELRLGDSQISIRGYATSAASLISVLDGSAYFADVKFTAPVTPESSLSREGFTLSATMTPEAKGG